MAAFVGGVPSSSFVLKNKLPSVSSKRSPSAIQMSIYPQTGLTNTRFSVRRVKKTAEKRVAAADAYFARSVTRQYKNTAVPFGVYLPQCTEGTIKGMAEEKRSAALSREFRLKQRSPAMKAHALFENRKQAIIGAHNCSYEEKLVSKYPALAAAFVLGMTEASRACSRYVVPETVAEEYMASAVDKQMKMRAVKGGVYSLSCAEGVAKGQAEQARVSALGTAFRSAQKGASATTAERYNAAKYGRVFHGHGCEHEEQEFNKFPACAAAMRPSSYGY
mmetsp:Transcript_9100/g.16372  ORF Transcript_9100/g.16372 Transcript_9100/m.16372 type:complete len:276 (-) Transcript_9100:93-920(-)